MPPNGDRLRPIVHVVFDGAALAEDVPIRLQEPELDDYRFAGDIARYLLPVISAQAAAALHGCGTGATMYLPWTATLHPRSADTSPFDNTEVTVSNRFGSEVSMRHLAKFERRTHARGNIAGSMPPLSLVSKRGWMIHTVDSSSFTHGRPGLSQGRKSQLKDRVCISIRILIGRYRVFD